MSEDLPPNDPVRRNRNFLPSGITGKNQARWADGTYGGTENLPSSVLRPVADILRDEEGPENLLREYWRVLLKYRMVILAAIALGGVLAMLYSFTVTPRYTARSKIRISTYLPVLAATKVEDILEEKSKESNYLETQIEELKSYSLADRVLEDPRLKEYFRKRTENESRGLSEVSADGLATYHASVEEIKKYLLAIDITPVRRTTLVQIDATAEDPRIAALMAQRHASSYIDWVRTVRVDQQSRAVVFLKQQAEELRIKVTDLEREMADYAEANAIVAVNKDENIVVQKMAQLNQMLTEAINKRLEAENLYKEADNSLKDESAGFDDASTQQMRSELSRLEGEYQQLSAKFMPGYPKMLQLKAQINGIKATIQGQRKQVSLGLKAKADAAIQQESRLREELELQKSKAFELSKKQVQYNSLNRELASSRDLLENVLKQMKETSLSVESNSSNVSIVDAPVIPTIASFPRKKMMLLVGVVLGSIVGCAAAFFLNYLDNSVRTPEDIANYLKVPSLGLVPSFELEGLQTKPMPRLIDRVTVEGESDLTDRSGSSGDSMLPRARDGERQTVTGLPVLFINNPRSLAAEAYRTIRTGIILSQAGEPPRTLLVTSAQSSEGKTTSSVNLAASLASSGARVILIEADLRRPSIHKHFNLPSGLPGLVDVITGQRTLAEVAQRELIKRVTLIPAGRIPPNPAELLGSFEMLSLLDKLAGEYDYVVVDSPPILPVTDSVVLSRFVDGVVLVVRAGATPRKIITDAKMRLVSVGARILGVVLNDVNFSGGDYYYYNKYYSSYYQDSDDAGLSARPSKQNRA